MAPTIWLYEVANVLRVGEKRNRLTENDSAEFCKLLALLPIEIAPVSSVNSVMTLIDTGRASGLSAYDAAYVALAKEKSLPLATLDSRVIAAAQALGVPIFSPELGSTLETHHDA